MEQVIDFWLAITWGFMFLSLHKSYYSTFTQNSIFILSPI